MPTGKRNPVQPSRLIREQRKKLDLSQADLAKLLDFKSNTMIANIEQDKASIPLNSWIKYADALKIPRHRFLESLICHDFPEMRPYISGFSDPIQRTLGLQILDKLG